MTKSRLMGALSAARSANPPLTSSVVPPKPSTLHLDKILDRANDTRPINEAHVQEMAASIEAVGLIQPIAVDKNGRLLVGGHRRAALRWLREQKPEVFDRECPNEEVLVRRYDFDALEDPDRALAIEASENEHRRDYTPSEVRSLADRLRTAGYHDGNGRPKKGEKNLTRELELIVKKSRAQIKRYLAESEELATEGTSEPIEKTISDETVLKRIAKQVLVLEERHPNCSEISALRTALDEAIAKLAEA
mgnify:CR=1 FL=1